MNIGSSKKQQHLLDINVEGNYFNIWVSYTTHAKHTADYPGEDWKTKTYW